MRLCFLIFLVKTQAITQKQNNTNYQRQLDELAADHHSTGTSLITNGGFMNLHVSYDFVWHYDVNRYVVVVTRANFQLKNGTPDKRGAGSTGFWDSYAFVKPSAPAPNEQGSWVIGPAGPSNPGDMPGITPDAIWNMVKSNAMAFFTQNSVTGQNEIKYGIQTPFDAVNDGNGHWILARTYTRYRAGNAGTGGTSYPRWAVSQPTIEITIPTLKTASVHYHYDVF